jgi:hypothetical protein
MSYNKSDNKPKIQLKPHTITVKGSFLHLFPIRIRPVYPTDLTSLSTCKKGDYVEWKIYDEISKFKDIIEIANISSISKNIYDLIVRLKDNSIKGIQVKMLYQVNKNKFQLKALEKCKYDDDTLIVAANLDYTRFALCFWKDIKSYSGFTINFLSSATDHIIKFNDITLFRQKLYELLPRTVNVNDIRKGILSSNDRLEYDSTLIIKKKAEQLGLKFEYENTTDSPIDFYINDYSCQLKVTSDPDHLLYYTHLTKKINGEIVSYEDTDNINYFIFMINDWNFRNDVLIIPTKYLLDRKYIKTDQYFGKKTIGFPPPNYPRFHPMESFWNNWEIIREGLNSLSDNLIKFLDNNKCSIKNISMKVANRYPTTISMSDMDNEFIINFINDKYNRLYKDWIWIISKKDLIRENKVPDGNLQRKGFKIVSPDYIGSDWSQQYWKKISDL